MDIGLILKAFLPADKAKEIAAFVEDLPAKVQDLEARFNAMEARNIEAHAMVKRIHDAQFGASEVLEYSEVLRLASERRARLNGGKENDDFRSDDNASASNGGT